MTRMVQIHRGGPGVQLLAGTEERSEIPVTRGHLSRKASCLDCDRFCGNYGVAGARELEAAACCPPLESCNAQGTRSLRHHRNHGIWIGHTVRGVRRIHSLMVHGGPSAESSDTNATTRERIFCSAEFIARRRGSAMILGQSLRRQARVCARLADDCDDRNLAERFKIMAADLFAKADDF